MAEESKIQSKIMDYLIKEDGWLCNKIIAASHSGWCDIIALKNGRVLFIEVKAKGKKPEPLQKYYIDEINKAGAFAIYADSLEMFFDKLNELERKQWKRL